MILIHPEAAAEARGARRWYAERDPAVGGRFQAEYDRAIERVHDDPDRWPRYPHLPGNFYWWRFRFPYAIIYGQSVPRR